MRSAFATLANLLVLLGLGGLVVAGSGWPPHFPGGWPSDGWLGSALHQLTVRQAPVRPTLPAATAMAGTQPPPATAAVSTPAPDPTETPEPEVAEPTPPPRLPITRLEVPRIHIQSDVLPAQIIRVPGGTTWDVPPFVVGHGDNTAGAGEAGNAVLLGHVVSPNAGDVFKDVNRMRLGDAVRIFSADREFDYVVVEIRTVTRTDLSVLLPTESASVTLLTCTGTWLPALQDYSHRLAVRAELAAPPSTG